MSVFTTIAGIKPASAAGGPSLVQQKSVGGDTSTSLVFDTPATAGNSLIVVVSARQTNIANIAVNLRDGGGGSLTLSKSQAGTGINNSIWFLHNIPSGVTGVDLQDNGAGARISGSATEWTGLANAVAEDTDSNSGSDTAVTTNSVTPASASNLVVGGAGWQPSNFYSSGPTGGFTRLTAFGSLNVWGEAAYLVQSSTTAASTGWTLSGALNYAATIAVFGGA